jgi:hypothetical protein
MPVTSKGVAGRVFLRMAQQVMRFSGKGIAVRAHRLARSAARCNSSKAPATLLLLASKASRLRRCRPVLKG